MNKKTLLLLLGSLLLVTTFASVASSASGIDYAVTSWSGPATVAPGAQFTRSAEVTNIGDAGGENPLRMEIRDVNATIVSVTGSGFKRCNDKIEYANCVKTYLSPGESASMTVTYVAGNSGTYVGYAKVISPNDTESDKQNNVSQNVVETVVSGGPEPTPTPTPTTTPGDGVTIAAVGDIACTPSSSSYNNGFGTSTLCRHKYVADLMQTRDVTNFLALGDLQYEDGTLSDFNTSYDKWYAPYYDITRPAPGNHEYRTTNASGYYNYFASKNYAQSPGYYSYDVGNWHLVALNSNCTKIGGCGTTKPQGQWLKADLAASNKECTIAYWHHPRFNSGEHGGVGNMTWAWNMMYAENGEIILNGHEHSYQRFQPLDSSGNVDYNRGIVEFVSGAGGKNHYSGGSTNSRSAFRNTIEYGMLFLTLNDGSADYEWVTENGVTKDSGTITCH
jgi:hypothetical protein